MSELRFAELDADGVLAEAVARVSGDTRAELLRRATVGAASVLGLLAAAGTDDAWAVDARDRDILNFALALEQLQSAFYTEAERIRAWKGRAAEATRVLGAVERAHVIALRKVLRHDAVKPARFDFRGTTEDERAFLKTAVAFEDLAVAAYKGQAPRIRSRAVLASAVSIHSVEARHAAWMRYLYGIPPVQSAFDEPVSAHAALRTVAATRFVSRRRKTARRRAPRFTG